MEKIKKYCLENGCIKELWFDEDGKLYIEKYYNEDNRIHRDGDKPAIIKYNKDGSILYENYCKNGLFHRDGDKPTMIEYNVDGSIITYENYLRMNI